MVLYVENVPLSFITNLVPIFALNMLKIGGNRSVGMIANTDYLQYSNFYLITLKHILIGISVLYTLTLLVIYLFINNTACILKVVMLI
jgi:hypothetical protein